MTQAQNHRDEVRMLDAGLTRAALALDRQIADSGSADRVVRKVMARVAGEPVRIAWFAIAAALLLAAGLGSAADFALVGARSDPAQQVVVLDPLVFGPAGIDQ
jgi:hypothetical protein